MPNAGYSGTPLARKLGIKPGFMASVYNEPGHYPDLFSELPEDVTFVKSAKRNTLDFIHIFATKRPELESAVLSLKPLMKKDGLMWVSWPKGSSKIPTDLNRDLIREYLLGIGLVDVKVAAIDEEWSGLKFVYRLKDR
ncbi:MAG: DUF3052 domain-containing protein [Cyclobacteriaceae bacterium]|nr:DUF3052 domain-containing protein [Cyclobacteriaceae bacterium HetDA_MAG_MS6]